MYEPTVRVLCHVAMYLYRRSLIVAFLDVKEQFAFSLNNQKKFGGDGRGGGEKKVIKLSSVF